MKAIREPAGNCKYDFAVHFVFIMNADFVSPSYFRMWWPAIWYRCLIWVDADFICGNVPLCYVNTLLCTGLNKRNSHALSCSLHISVSVALLTRFLVPRRPRELQEDLFILRLLNAVAECQNLSVKLIIAYCVHCYREKAASSAGINEIKTGMS